MRRPTRKVVMWMRVRDDGAPIRRARKRRGYTQRELAFLARPCSHTAVHLIETGKMRTLSDELALRIAQRLEVDVEDLFEARSALRTPALSHAAATNDAA